MTVTPVLPRVAQARAEHAAADRAYRNHLRRCDQVLGRCEPCRALMANADAAGRRVVLAENREVTW